MIQANELRVGNWFIPITDDGFELEPRQLKAVELYALAVNPSP